LDRLPTETQEFAAMLAHRWTQRETAQLLGYDESTMAQAISTLRSEMLSQLEGHNDLLSRKLRSRADELAGRARPRAA
jgi:hypothetical protein